MELEQKIEAEVIDKGPEDQPDPNANDGEEAKDERDYEAEARALGWQSPDEFKGDPSKLVDAKTFVERGEVMLPLIKKQLATVKRDFDEYKRVTKQALKFMGDAEKRGYERAMKELDEKHAALVEEGDVKGAAAVAKEMRDLAKPEVPEVEDEAKPDQAELRKELDQWVEENDWYVTDANKRLYADSQAAKMGSALEWPDGRRAWFAELTKRVDRKFADRKPNPVNGGGNREKPNGAAKGYADLPAAAKAQADRFHRMGAYGDKSLEEARKLYAKDYDWSSAA